MCRASIRAIMNQAEFWRLGESSTRSSTNLMYSLEGKSTVILIPRTSLESDFQKKKNHRKNNLTENKNKKKRESRTQLFFWNYWREGPDVMKSFVIWSILNEQLSHWKYVLSTFLRSIVYQENISLEVNRNRTGERKRWLCWMKICAQPFFQKRLPPDRKKDESKWTTLQGHVKLNFQVRGWRDVRYATWTSTCISSLILLQPVLPKGHKIHPIPPKFWTAFRSSARTLTHPIAVSSGWRYPNLKKTRNHISLIDKFAVSFWKCDWWTSLASHKRLALVMDVFNV